MHLAASYKKEKEWAEAACTWQSMIAQGAGGTLPYIELAKYYEHIARDIPRALHHANAALVYLLNAAVLFGEDEAQTALIRRRIERLKRKMEKASQDDVQEE